MIYQYHTVFDYDGGASYGTSISRLLGTNDVAFLMSPMNSYKGD